MLPFPLVALTRRKSEDLAFAYLQWETTPLSRLCQGMKPGLVTRLARKLHFTQTCVPLQSLQSSRKMKFIIPKCTLWEVSGTSHPCLESLQVTDFAFSPLVCQLQPKGPKDVLQPSAEVVNRKDIPHINRLWKTSSPRPAKKTIHILFASNDSYVLSKTDPCSPGCLPPMAAFNMSLVSIFAHPRKPYLSLSNI